MTAQASDCWIVTNGAAGNRRQAQALSDALALNAEVIDVALNPPWRWFSPHWMRGRTQALQPPITPPWPRVAIGCGRAGAVALDAMPSQANGGPLRIQILNPRCPSDRFDVLIAPTHDRIGGANLVQITGSLNPITPAWLAAAREQHAELLQSPAPRTLLLTGGRRRQAGFGRTQLRELLKLLEHWQQRDLGSLWISLSRRTPATWRACIEAHLPRLGEVRLWRGEVDGNNPYRGWIASADRIVVTPDSVNMLSEGCATGNPVFTHAPRGVSGRLGELHRSLRDSGCLRPLRLEYQSWQYAPLQECARVAAQLETQIRLALKADR